MKKLVGGFVALLTFVGAASAGDFPAVKVQKINDRVYAMLGPHDPPNKENGGYMNNNLVIIGDKGVILVDAGSHNDVAEHIDAAIKTVTKKPITHVLITHHHGDHHLGLSYFDDAQVIASSYCTMQVAEGTWKVNDDGTQCVDGIAGGCARIVSNGDGTYDRNHASSGKTLLKWNSFVNGKDF
jgi:glyoxylase-like metal-dependent hydrolase (beta-lactamase superfamily II)